jgi:hypothetical protein
MSVVYCNVPTYSVQKSALLLLSISKKRHLLCCCRANKNTRTQAVVCAAPLACSVAERSAIFFVQVTLIEKCLLPCCGTLDTIVLVVQNCSRASAPWSLQRSPQIPADGWHWLRTDPVTSHLSLDWRARLLVVTRRSSSGLELHLSSTSSTRYLMNT